MIMSYLDFSVNPTNEFGSKRYDSFLRIEVAHIAILISVIVKLRRCSRRKKKPLTLIYYNKIMSLMLDCWSFEPSNYKEKVESKAEVLWVIYRFWKKLVYGSYKLEQWALWQDQVGFALCQMVAPYANHKTSGTTFLVLWNYFLLPFMRISLSWQLAWL